MWKSQESERRLRDATEGRRERSCADSSSPAPPRPVFPATGPPATRPGFARRIFGEGDGSDAIFSAIAHSGLGFSNSSYALNKVFFFFLGQSFK